MRFSRKYAVNALFVALAIVFAVATESSVAQKSGKQHWRNMDILGSVGLVMAVDKERNCWDPYGSGVFIDADSAWPTIFFVTNRHIYLGRDSLKISYKRYKIEDTLSVLSAESIVIHKSKSVFCPSSDDSDFVAIRLDRESAAGINVVAHDRIVPFEQLEYGEQVIFYGYPQYQQTGLAGTAFNFPVARGGILSWFANEEVYDDTNKIMIPKMFLLDGVSLGGGSGSPIFIKRPYINNDMLIVNDIRFAGIIKGHYSVPQTITLPLSKIPIVSQALDDTVDVRDSLFISKFLADFQFSYEENSNLAFAISSDLILEYIRQQYRKEVIEPLVDEVLLVMRYWQ